MAKGRKRTKRKIRLRQSARLVHKNDATRVTKPDTTRYPKVEGRPPASVAPVFRVKIRKKQ